MRADVCKRVRVGVETVRAWPLWEVPGWLVGFIVAVVVAYVAAVGLAARNAAEVDARGLITFGAPAAVPRDHRRADQARGRGCRGQQGRLRGVGAPYRHPAPAVLRADRARPAGGAHPGAGQADPAVPPGVQRHRDRAVLRSRLGRLPYPAACGQGAHRPARCRGLTCLSGCRPWPGPAWSSGRSTELLVLPAVRGADPTLRIRDMLCRTQPGPQRRRRAVRGGPGHPGLGHQSSHDRVRAAVRNPAAAVGAACPAAQRLPGRFEDGLAQRGYLGARGRLGGGPRSPYPYPLALVLVDVDHFKLVNDLHGHLAGDKALRAIAHAFQIFLRSYDQVGRFGGEEFALLLPQTSPADARQIAERMRAHIAETPISVSDDPAAPPVRLTVSMGVAALGRTWERTTGSQLTDLLACADRALYEAKNAGRNHVVMVTETATVGVAVANPGRLPRLSGLLSRWAAPPRPVSGDTPWWPGIPGSRARSGWGDAEPEGMARTASIPRAPSSTVTCPRCGGSRGCRIPCRPSP